MIQGQPGYSEETAFNPSTCQARVISGGLTPASQAMANNGITLSPKLAPTTLAAPSSLGISSAAITAYADFEKVSYVDPVDLTIISLVSKINWKSNGTSITAITATPVSYKFNWDQWSASPITSYFAGYPSFPGFTSAQYSQTFTNTDFERYLVSILGVAAYAACGFDSSPAIFYLSPGSEGFANGYYDYGSSQSVSGGCSNLFHFRENHGAGFSS